MSLGLQGVGLLHSEVSAIIGESQIIDLYHSQSSKRFYFYFVPTKLVATEEVKAQWCREIQIVKNQDFDRQVVCGLSVLTNCCCICGRSLLYQALEYQTVLILAS